MPERSKESDASFQPFRKPSVTHDEYDGMVWSILTLFIYRYEFLILAIYTFRIYFGPI